MAEDNRCTVPFFGAFTVRLQERYVTSCCRVLAKPFNESTGLLIPEIIELRKSILKNERNEQCATCWKRDDEHGLSHRRRHSKHFANPKFWETYWQKLNPTDPVIAVEVTFSNKCQLMCAYCGPGISKMWENAQDNFSIFKNNKIEVQYSTDVSLNDVVDVDKLKFIGVTGGEPMLEPMVIDFLEKLEPNMNRNMAIITNLSYGDAVFDKLVDITERHKRIDVITSLDFFGENPTRKYLNWELWKKNFDTLVSKLPERNKIASESRVGIIITISRLNYNQVQPIIEYILSYRKQGIKNLFFVLNTLDDGNIISLRSGRLDTDFSVQLSEEDTKYLSEYESNSISSYNKFIKDAVVDEELKKASEIFLNEYLK
jgi:wyosine [tRNA(Phe)-imidazoG37] synthetase (radical SAM superfamily)